MSKYEIEKGVPIPPDKRRLNREGREYVWGDLEVGDSFFVAREGDETATQTRKRLSSAATNFTKRHGPKFTCRIVEENGAEGVRVWRIK